MALLLVKIDDILCSFCGQPSLCERRFAPSGKMAWRDFCPLRPDHPNRATPP